jgi:hypothetical protein
MRRREFVAALGAAGAAGVAGCGAVRSDTALSDPTVLEESPGRKSLEWTANGESVANFGADGSVSGGVVDLPTELSHREGTDVTRIELRAWMPDAETAADVAVVSPVEGDSSPPPAVALYTPDRALGTVIEITDLDDLADETISTLDLIVRPRGETATELTIDATIELTEGGALGSDYTLRGELELAFPGLAEG